MTSRRPPVLPVLLALAPLLLGTISALVLVLLRDERMLRIGIALPLVCLLAGAVLSLGAALVVVWRTGRRRSATRVARAREEGIETGTSTERENHRRFLARLDHELKNPLTAIRATAAAAGTVSAEWRTVDAQARKLSDLVRDLRKLAELETRPLEREEVELESLLDEAIAAIAQQDPAAGARLSLTVTRVPWAVPAVSVDVDLLSLAIDNVLANAVKYSSTGPIEVRLREQDGWAVIEVADAGRGIPAAELPLVFDELARAQNARDVAGSGLGLTLVATVMARHRGTIGLRSVEGAGSVATLRVPLRA